MKLFLIFLIAIQLSQYIKCKFPDNKTSHDLEEIYSVKYLEFDTEFEKNNLYLEKSKNYAFPNTIRINNKGILFISVPRHLFGDKIDSYIPGTINTLTNGKLDSK